MFSQPINNPINFTLTTPHHYKSPMPALTIPKDYGYVMLVGVGSSIMMLYLGKNVSNARKKFGVQYPSLYADQAAAEKDENKK